MSIRILLLALALAAPAVLRAAVAGAVDSAAAAPASAVAADIPQSFPANRYDKLIEKSPFAPATPVADPNEVAGFAQNLYVTGIGKIGNQDCVYIASRADDKARYTLFSGEEGPQGMKIERINYSNDIGRTKVTIRKGGDSATLQFDQAVLLHTAAPTAPQQPQINVPRLGGPIQPGQLTNGNQQPGPGGGPPGESRRRIRIINNRQ
jgi:hypothetical protein